jgi:hypothetical protein
MWPDSNLKSDFGSLVDRLWPARVGFFNAPCEIID